MSFFQAAEAVQDPLLRAGHLLALELPRGKAAEVGVELVQAWVVAIVGEFTFELQFVRSNRLLAHRAWSPDPKTAPCALWPMSRDPSGEDARTSFFSDDRFVRHVTYLTFRTREADSRCRLARIIKPDARGLLRQPEYPVVGGSSLPRPRPRNQTTLVFSGKRQSLVTSRASAGLAPRACPYLPFGKYTVKRSHLRGTRVTVEYEQFRFASDPERARSNMRVRNTR